MLRPPEKPAAVASPTRTALPSSPTLLPPYSRHPLLLPRRFGQGFVPTAAADVAAVVFSPAGKAFSFGHPSVESLIDRFLDAAASSPGPGAPGASRAVSELNRQYGELRALLDAEKTRRERVNKERVARSPAVAWVDAEVDDMRQDDLVAFGAALADVQAAVAARADQMLRDALLVGRRSRQPDLSAFFSGGGPQMAPPGFAGVEELQGHGHASLMFGAPFV